MLDRNELSKYFSKAQQQDMIELEITCMNTPRGRVRRARPRKVNPDHIPRPVNSFMSYRTEKQQVIKRLLPKANHRDISKMVAKWWHQIGPAEKSIYVDQAKRAKEAHTEMYPDYTFRPKCKGRKSKKSAKNEEEEDLDVVSDDNDVCTTARTRPYVKTIKQAVKAIKSHKQMVAPANDIFVYRNISSSSGTTKHEVIASPTNDNLYHHTYSGMYTDEVLFQSKEVAINNSNYWGTSYQSSEQVMANAFPTLNPPQNSYAYCGYSPTLNFYPSPLPPTLCHESIEAVNPTALQSSNHMPIYDASASVFYANNMNSYANTDYTTNVYYNSTGVYNCVYDNATGYNMNMCNNNGGYVNQEGQLFSGYSYEITPQSQAMNTPILLHTQSPSSPPSSTNNGAFLAIPGSEKIQVTEGLEFGVNFALAYPDSPLPTPENDDSAFLDLIKGNKSCMFGTSLPTDVLSHYSGDGISIKCEALDNEEYVM